MRKIIGNEIIAIFHALNGWAFPYFAIGVLFGMWFHMVVERSLAVRAESRKSRGIQYVDPSAVKIEAMAQRTGLSFLRTLHSISSPGASIPIQSERMMLRWRRPLARSGPVQPSTRAQLSLANSAEPPCCVAA